MERDHRLTKWKPDLVFYNSETKDIYRDSKEYDDLVSDTNKEGVIYSTELCAETPALKIQRDVIIQIKKMMQSSLPNQIKGLPNGKDI